jgi:hypothetical protein
MTTIQPQPWRPDLERFTALLHDHFSENLISVVLFGSWARGEARPDSDLDLLVVARGLPRSPLDRQALLFRLARRVSDEFADRVMPVALTPAEAERVKPFYLGMLSGHEVLRDSGRFFSGVLDRLRGRLAELGARRYEDEDGYEYWDLKPDWKPGDVVSL